MKDLKRFTYFTIIGILIIVAADFGLGYALEYLHSKMKGGERGRAYFAINKSEAEVYVFGSSRALYHYNPEILQDSLHQTVYNAGRSAQTLLYHLPVFKMILKRNKPGMVILDINEMEFVKEEQKYDLVNSLLPYYHSDRSVQDMINFIKPGYKYFSWSHTLPYNSSLFAILYRSITSRGESKDINGYISMRGNREKEVRTLNNCGKEEEYDPVIISALHEFVDLCRKNSIKLLVVTSPRFINTDCPRNDLQRVKQELKQLNVDYLDYSDNPKYVANLDYMYDESHLNYDGSVEFTKDIAHYIKTTFAHP